MKGFELPVSNLAILTHVTQIGYGNRQPGFWAKLCNGCAGMVEFVLLKILEFRTW
jgi:hypothetical protein